MKRSNFPFTEPSDTLVQMEVVDPSLNKEAALAKEFPTNVDSEETVSEPLVQPSEVQGNKVFSRVFSLHPESFF